MQRAYYCLGNLVETCFINSSTNYRLQFVRWRRRPNSKPYWLGRAKSKLFIFDEREPFRPGEEIEVKKLFNDYRHTMKSLYNYFKEEYERMSDTSEIGIMKAKVEDEEHKKLMEENRIENERMDKLRKERLAAQTKARHTKMDEEVEQLNEKERKRLEEADELIRYYKKQPVITLETLDEAIDRALETEVDYNFSIDLSGNHFYGRRTLPNTSQELLATGKNVSSN